MDGEIKAGQDFMDAMSKGEGGNEACEKLATVCLLANMIIYLTKEFNMPNVAASYILDLWTLNLWTGTTNLFPLLGAFIFYSYIARHWTIALGCVASLVGMAPLFYGHISTVQTTSMRH